MRNRIAGTLLWLPDPRPSPKGPVAVHTLYRSTQRVLAAKNRWDLEMMIDTVPRVVAEQTAVSATAEPTLFSAAALAAVRAMPGFALAADRIIDGRLGLNYRDPARHRLFADRGKLMIAFYALYLNARPNETGCRLTASRLEATCVEHGFSGRVRVRTMIQLMLHAGYLEIDPEPADGRFKPLLPTARLADYHLEYWTQVLGALAGLRPDLAASLQHLERPSFRNALCVVVGDAYPASPTFARRPDRLAGIGELDSGWLIMLRLASARRGGVPGPSANALSRQCGVSRSHVANVLRLAGETGLIDREGTAKAFQASAALVDRVEAFCAETLVLFADAVPRALALEAA